MKKSLVIVSFAFIFLLTISIVSVSAGLWITGDVQSSKAGAKVTPTEINERDSGTTFTRTAGVSATSSQRRSSIPNSWTAVKRADGNGDCYLPPERSQRKSINNLWGRDNGPQPIKVGDPCKSGGKDGTYAMGSQSMYCKFNPVAMFK